MFKENNSTSISSKSRNGALKKQPTSKIHNAKAVAENQLLGINRMVDLKIIVEGKIIKYFHHLSLKQSSSNHHSFKLKLPYDALGNPENHELNEAQNFLGKRITIVFAYKGLTETPERTFVGVILEVTYEQEQGSLGSIVLIGNSPTLLLDAATHTQSFGGSQSISLNSIAESVIKEGLSSSQFDYRVDSAYIKNISYSSQYNETHYNYLARMAEAYGEQFFYDGEVLHFGTLPPQETPIELIYGSNVSDIKIKMKALHVNPTFYGYNSSKNEKLTSGNSSIKHNSDIAKRAYQISQQTFQTPSLRVAPIKATTYKDVDASQKGTAGSQASEVFITSGKTSIPFMYPGCIAEIKMRKNTSNKTSYFTKLMVTEVHHEVDGRGNYEGNFQAIAADSGFLPRPIFENPLAEAQVATVISNTDPENQGRIQVRFDWQLHDTTEFIRVMTPDAGSSGKVSKNRGFMAIPEVGDQVMVNFQHNHPDRPFVMGGLFHGKVGGGGGSGNNIKSLSSKSGHIIELNDGGGMMIRDKNGNHVTLSGDGDITTQVSNDNTENIGHNHTTNVKTKTTINVGKGQSVLMMDDTGAISVESIKEIKFKTGSSSIMMDKDGNITIKGINITVEGTTTKIIGSSLAEIGKKGANAGMKIDGDVTIKGGKIIEN
jgi:type VI secretion system secreted protein VgrG